MNTHRLIWKLALVHAACFCSPASGQLALIRQGKESRGAAETGDFFGSAVALGDFNGDGFQDLATGAPSEKNGESVQQSGNVIINWGTPFGLTWEGATSLGLIDGGYDSGVAAGMGAALVTGDFDGNGCDDLAVGLPTVTVSGVTTAGAVFVYYGNGGGISQAAQVLHQGNFQAAIESGDLFGWALASGRIGSDSYDDLVIGSPGENGDKGAVFIVRGSALGLNNTEKQILMGADLGEASESGDRFGRAIAVGNVLGSSYAELIVGAPFAEDPANLPNTGRVYLAMGTTTGISISEANTRIYTPESLGLPLTELARFGAALAIGDLWGDGGNLDLAVGAPGAEIGGRVSVSKGGPVSLSWQAPLKQEGALNGADKANDDFGYSLAIGDHDDDGFDDLAVGNPGESFQGNAQVSAGAVYLFSGSINGPTQLTGTRILNSHLGDSTIATGWFGRALAMGKTSASPRESLLIGAPLANGGAGVVYDVAPWRQLYRPGCRSALSVDCEGDIIYALRPFESVRMASTAKIMTLLLGCEATQRPQNDPLRVGLNESYAIEPWMYEAFPSSSPSSKFLFTPIPANQAPEEYTFNELLRILFPVSGNDVAYAIADKMFGDVSQWDGFSTTAPGFVALMNARAQAIGMTGTTFTNPAGVDVGAAFSTAYDMWLLSEEAMKNSLFREIANTVEYEVDKIVSPAPGQFVTMNVKLPSQWLQGLKQSDSRIVGLKPGSTPEAKSTGVLAARPTPQSDRLVYANGFGWNLGWQVQGQEVELIQMALDRCNSVWEGPKDKVAPPVSKHPWITGTLDIQGIQFGAFDGLGADSGSPVDLISWAPNAPDGACFPLVWNHSALWMILPGEEVGADFEGLSLGEGELRNVGREMGGSEGTVRISIARGEAGGTIQPHSLDETAGLLLPAVQAFTSQQTFRIKNLGTEPIYLSYTGRYEVKMKYHDLVFRASLKPVGEAIDALMIINTVATNGPIFEAVVAIENRANGLRFLPEPVIESHEFIFPDDPREAISGYLKIGGIDGDLVPLKPFYRALRVEASSSMNRDSWVLLGEVLLDSNGPYETTQTLPPGSPLFLRVVGVEPEEID